jgi:hypothetical protein
MFKFVKTIEQKAANEWRDCVNWVLSALVDLGDAAVKGGLEIDADLEKILNEAHDALMKEKAKIEEPK